MRKRTNLQKIKMGFKYVNFELTIRPWGREELKTDKRSSLSLTISQQLLTIISYSRKYNREKITKSLEHIILDVQTCTANI